jgi:hypothetical protein
MQAHRMCDLMIARMCGQISSHKNTHTRSINTAFWIRTRYQVSGLHGLCTMYIFISLALDKQQQEDGVKF